LTNEFLERREHIFFVIELRSSSIGKESVSKSRMLNQGDTSSISWSDTEMNYGGQMKILVAALVGGLTLSVPKYLSHLIFLRQL
jgi:hypothetical protein